MDANKAVSAVSRRYMTVLGAGLALAAVGLSQTAYARTWHAAKSDQTLEGDFMELDKGNVSIRNDAGKLFTVKLGQLSAEDQKYVTQQVASGAKPPPKRPAPPPAKGAATRTVACPLTIEVSPMTGGGSERKADYALTNNGSKAVKGFDLRFFYLKSDGSVGDTSPFNCWGFGGSGDNGLQKGGKYTNQVNSFFMEDDTAGVDATVTGITFEDDTEWPEVPATPPQNGSDPVAGLVVGVIGKGLCVEPLAACYNYDEREVKGVSYRILYLDADAKTVGETSYGIASDKPIIKKGSGIVVSGGNAPPPGAADAKVIITDVDFADGSKWQPAP